MKSHVQVKGLALGRSVKFRRQGEIKLGKGSWWWGNGDFVTCCFSCLGEKTNHQLRMRMGWGSWVLVSIFQWFKLRAVASFTEEVSETCTGSHMP